MNKIEFSCLSLKLNAQDLTALWNIKSVLRCCSPKLKNNDVFLCLGDCINFVIDDAVRLVILFENVYEIYGDIQGATNSFHIKAYEQGKRNTQLH